MSKLIAFRLTDDEVADLDARAKNAGVSRSSFIRACLFEPRITAKAVSNAAETPQRPSHLPPFSETWRR
jgi:hypothetical protein